MLNGSPLGIRSLDSTTLWRTRASARSNNRACSSSTTDDYENTEAMIRDYFQLDTPLVTITTSQIGWYESRRVTGSNVDMTIYFIIAIFTFQCNTSSTTMRFFLLTVN